LPGTPVGADVDVLLRETAGIYRVALTPSARDQLVGYARASEDGREVGGIVVAVVDRPGLIAVTDIGPCGPRAVREPGSLRPDGDHDIALSDALVEQLRGGICEVGQWHTHPAGGARPSTPDMRRSASLLPHLQQQAPRLSCFLDLIVTAHPGRDAFGARGWRRPNVAAWVTRYDDGRGGFVCEPARDLRGL
jgi:integrative and conjugative element protein (TIGR02256 family)